MNPLTTGAFFFFAHSRSAAVRTATLPTITAASMGDGFFFAALIASLGKNDKLYSYTYVIAEAVALWYLID